MKKVFAVLSVLALTIAVVGFSTKNVQSAKADDLFVEDPTINENEIPMYIMNSIYTTFPKFYDYANGGDDYWGGAARMYPWNETRLQIKQMDADGNYTGKEYAIFFAGSTSADNLGAGNNILFYDVDASGNVTAARMDGGKNASGGQAMDPSLSHLRSNRSEYDAYFNPKTFLASSSSEGDTYYNRLFVFDEDGHMIRGLLGNPAYAKAGSEGANTEVLIAPEFCYVDGVVTYMEDGVVCDKVMEDVLDEDGQPIIINEETGETQKQATDEDNLFYTRFVWQWYPAEYVEAPEFIGVNKFIGQEAGVDYLQEGWDGEKWDYAKYEEESDGYICYCFLPSENSTAAYTADQAAAQEGKTTSSVRTCASIIWVPAGGYSFDFGYLDKGQPVLYNYATDFFNAGLYYGRQSDDEGKGMAYRQTYNFSAKPLYAQDVSYNGNAYKMMTGQNTIEVLQGESIKPAQNVVYTGLARYWQTPGDLTSYKSDTKVLDMWINVNGSATEVAPSTGYTSFEDMVADFCADFSAWKTAKSGAEFTLAYPGYSDGEALAFFEGLGWDLAGLDASTSAFTGNAEMWAKWSWMFNLVIKMAGSGSVNWSGNGAVSSPGTSRAALYSFFTGYGPSNPNCAGIEFSAGNNGQRAIPGFSTLNCRDWSTPEALAEAREWLDTRSNADKWNQFTIDTSTAAVDTNYDVEFVVKNAETGNESTFNIKYVVVDEYTPTIEVNKNALSYYPTKNGNKVEMPVIDPMKLVSAYNGKYNGSIKGDDITYKVHFSSETLDFNAVTEGQHAVTARVYSASGAKYAEVTFNVSVEDVTAPRAFCYDAITLPFGAYWNPTMAVSYAYDAVDGNLMDNEFRGWIVDESSPVVNTQKAGNYTVKLTISDKSDNNVTVQTKVTVLPEAASSTSLKKEVETVTDAIDGLLEVLDEQSEAIADIAAQVAALDEQVKAMQNTVNDVQTATAGCGKKGLVVVELAAAASLLVVFLRKRH